MAEYDGGFTGPFQKLYFSDQMVLKYEPLASAIKKLEDDPEDQAAQREHEEFLKEYQKMDWCSNWDGVTYDIVFYGVSGYTGYLMMEYLKRVSLKRNPEPFTFAFAGRTVSKVADMRDREFKDTKWEDTPVLQMSYDDMYSIIDLVKSAKCIINVAGPYMLTQGELMIDCCGSLGVSYCDISGEIPWTLRLLELHKNAMKNGAYICPSSASAGGFPDLGVFMCAKKAKGDYNEELRKAVCYCSGGGASAGSSGGTLKTRAAMASAGDEVRKKMADPFSLGGYVPDRDRWGFKSCTIENGTGRVNMKMRGEDMDANMSKISEDKKFGFWRGPFVYSYFDTRIVRRSNMLFADLGNCPYGKNLNFLEYAMLPTEAVLAAGKGAGGGGGGGGGAGGGGGGGGGGGPGAVGVEAEKAALEAAGKYYKEGEGPPLEELDDAWVGFFLYAETESGHEIKCSMVGRDGYFETARVAVETAMCLVFDREKLQFKGGVLTPTVAGGTHLIQRIIDSGLKFKMGGWHAQSELAPPPFP